MLQPADHLHYQGLLLPSCMCSCYAGASAAAFCMPVTPEGHPSNSVHLLPCWLFRALDADMPEALEGIKRSVAALQQEMSAGKVQELQDELVALAAQVAVMPKEQPKVLADTVMTMLDSAAVCLQDHDKQLVDVRQQVTALEELLGGSKGGEESEGSGKVAGVMSNVAALQAQVAALEVSTHGCSWWKVVMC
jgi:hypothetical protein